MTSKRGHDPPTGDTPGKKPQKVKREAHSKRALFQSASAIVSKAAPSLPDSKWSDSEIKDLIEFIALYHDSEQNAWPTHKKTEFWTSCAEAVNTRGNNSRSGTYFDQSLTSERLLY